MVALLRLLSLVIVLALPGAAHAQKTIDQLTPGSALTGPELIPMVQSANPAVTTTPGAISTYLHVTPAGGGGIQLPSTPSAAGNEILCYNTSGSAVTYQSSVGGCVPSAIAAKNPLGTIDAQAALAGVMRLTPGVYTYRDAETLGSAEHDGLYADEVCALDERLCVRENGVVRNYDKSGVIAHLVAAIQAQQREIELLRQRIK